MLKRSEEKPGKILVIEDEVQIRRLLRTYLERNGYGVMEAGTGAEGLNKTKQSNPDAIFLDLGLPDMDGMKVLKKLREWSKVPVLIVSARSDVKDKIAALDNGANDYVTKPFNTSELLARLRAVQRHSKMRARKAVFSTGRLEINLTNRLVKVSGKRVRLTATEYAILRLFVNHADEALNKKYILREIWGPAGLKKITQLRVYINSLRRKVENDPARPQLILTETRIGYRFVASDTKLD